MKVSGWDLSFFNSGEWQVIDERLKDLEKTAGRIGRDGFNPGRKSLFAALRATSYGQTRVCVIGQDPYPQEGLSTGLAFSIPASVEREDFPPTLKTIFSEYQSDLHHPYPSSGVLTPWTGDNGVLLWNAVPSCRTGQSLSQDWDEWRYLTREIITTLAKKGIVFALLGQVARSYLNDIDLSNNSVVVTSHPSPRGSRSSNTPFLGSRIFSTINDKLNDLALRSIDWKLP